MAEAFEEATTGSRLTVVERDVTTLKIGHATLSAQFEAESAKNESRHGATMAATGAITKAVADAAREQAERETRREEAEVARQAASAAIAVGRMEVAKDPKIQAIALIVLLAVFAPQALPMVLDFVGRFAGVAPAAVEVEAPVLIESDDAAGGAPEETATEAPEQEQDQEQVQEQD